jgi:hypothetical protein
VKLFVWHPDWRRSVFIVLGLFGLVVLVVRGCGK